MIEVSGVVLAGGQGSRMGGVDKGLQEFRGKPMVAHAIERLAPQVGEIIINANRNVEEYRAFGHRVVSDSITGFAGPLAGFERGLDYAKGELVMTVPCDSPFLPTDLVPRLRAALERADAELAVAKTGDQPHPVFCLMRRSLHGSLRWYSTHKVVEVPFDDEAQAFMNINTKAELSDAE